MTLFESERARNIANRDLDFEDRVSDFLVYPIRVIEAYASVLIRLLGMFCLCF